MSDIIYGPTVEGDRRKINAAMPEYAGRHLWIYTCVFEVGNPARSEQTFDNENLLSVIGPCCYHCEQAWRPTIGSKCPGEPTE